METRIKLLLLIAIIVLVVFNYPYIENFFDLGSNMIEFTRLDGSLIKKIKVGSSTSLYDQEVLNLFRVDQVIRINIPDNYSVRIIYKFRNESKGFGKTVELSAGSYDISKQDENKQIFQIDVSHDYGLVNNSRGGDLFIKDIDGNIIYSGPEIVPIDWDLVYTNFGYDDYYIYYPSTNMLRTYYYYNYPRYKLYWPSKRMQRRKYYSSGIIDKFYRYRSDFNTNSGQLLLKPPNRITVGVGTTQAQARPLIRGKGQWLIE
jgi:hypothetical protein